MSDFIFAKLDLSARSSKWRISQSPDNLIAKSGKNRITIQKSWQYPATFLEVYPEGICFGYIQPIRMGELFPTDSWADVKKRVNCFSEKFPFDEFLFCFVETELQTVELIRDIHCTLPLFVYRAKGLVILSNSFESIINDSYFAPKLDRPALAATLAFLPSYTNRTIFLGLLRVTERSHTVIGKDRYDIDYWNVDIPVVTASKTRFAELLEETVLHRYDSVKDVRVGVELSGGLDSSTVTGIIASSKTQLPTFSIAFPGRGGRSQRGKIKSLEEHFSLDCRIIPIGRALPLSERRLIRGRRQFYRSDIYEAALTKLARHASKKVDVICTGIGGDELFLVDKGEKSNFRSKKFTDRWMDKPMPDFFTPAFHKELKRFLSNPTNLPLPSLSYSVYGAHWATNNIFIHQMIWPIAPLADPVLTRFCRSLPKGDRHRKQVMRSYQQTNNYPKLIRADENENFREVFWKSYTTTGASIIEAAINQSVLAKIGLINQQQLVKAYKRSRLEKLEVRPIVVYGIVVVELLLQALAGKFAVDVESKSTKRRIANGN